MKLLDLRFAWAFFLGLLSLPAAAIEPLGDVVQVAGGSNHTCALRANGSVMCWGSNVFGQLGDIGLHQRQSAAPVPSLANGVTRIATGFSHTCAIASGGGVHCWGLNTDGQLGDGSTTSRRSPVAVSGLVSGIADIAAGELHTCALTTGGGVKCWGQNHLGMLGNGSQTPSLTPVDVSGLASGVTAISAGKYHTCALTTGGAVKCWGDARVSGGSATSTAVDVPGLTTGIGSIAAAGFHTCALTTGGAVKCWGANFSGQLGDGSRDTRPLPVDVVGLTGGVTAISARSNHTCALTSGGAVKCWGSNFDGQLGDASKADHLTPFDVPGLASGAASVAAAGNHTCAVMASGSVKCWGLKITGELGDALAMTRPMPVATMGLAPGVVRASAGNQHTCAVTSGGGVQCWGQNLSGQLGNNSTVLSLAPADVSGFPSGIAAIAAGLSHTCAVTTGGGAKCWGSNNSGQVGDNSTQNRMTPVDVQGLTTGVAAIASGSNHTCAVTSPGGVKCWGNNGLGQLGNGEVLERFTPVDVVGLSSGVAAISAGALHTCALTSGGGAKCWGNNGLGQLGDNSTMHRLEPVDVSGLSSGVVAIAPGGAHTCALLTAGGVKCWGNNGFGQLGDGSTTQSLVPIDVSGLSSGVVAIAASGAQTCALLTTGGVKCWGSNWSGAVGDNSYTTRTTPVDVSGLSSGVVAITAGGAHSCAVLADGSMKCWGESQFAALGDGTADFRPFPADVMALPTVSITTAPTITAANETSYSVSGNCMKDGSSVDVQIESIAASATCGVPGSGQFTTGAVNVSALMRGPVSLVGAMTDASGDSGTSTLTTMKDTSRPTQSTSIGMLDAITAANKDSFAFTGSCANGHGSVSYWLTPSAVAGGTAPCSNWSYAVTGVNLSAVPDGPVTVSVEQGTWSANGATLKDTVRPRVTIDPPQAITQLNQAAYTVRGTCSEAGREVTITAGGARGTALCGSPIAGLYEISGLNVTDAAPNGTAAIEATLTSFPGGNATARTTVPKDTSTTGIPRLGNISTRGLALTGSDVMISGFIVGGATPKTVAITVAGPSLANAGIANPLADPRITLVRQSDSMVIASNDNWQDAANAPQLQTAGFAPAHPLEPAILIALAPGAYTAIVTAPPGVTGVALAGVYEVDQPSVPLINISTRGQVRTGSDVMIAGFIVQGIATQTVVVTVAGASLANAGVANPLLNPMVTIVRQSDGAVIATNDNWEVQTHQADKFLIENAGFAPAHVLEPAVYLTLPPGAYTAIVQGVGGSTGVGLVGVYRVATP